jgi:50S ribosomal protein L16 3-hydroxylase
MDTNTPLALLGGLTASQFMRRHWHKKPLLVRQAIPGFKPLIPRARLLAMAGEDGVESRLIQQLDGGAWKLSHGPLSRRSLPSLQKPGWTVLVQGVDLHDDGVHQLMQQFRFVPEARLDDLMISFATDGGGPLPPTSSCGRPHPRAT